MRSFLPNCTLINAWTHCANPDCDNKEAESLLTLKMCTACRSVSYCGVDCQKAHRQNHKSQCKQEAQNLKKTTDYINENSNDHVNNEDNNDNELFRPIPPKDDCPICTRPLPIKDEGRVFMACCGNRICRGCCEEDCRATLERKQKPRCAYCRELHPSSEKELIVRMKKQMEKNDSDAIVSVAHLYKEGQCGLPKDPQKAFKLFRRAADLGNSDGWHNLATFYYDSVVVAKDITKVREYYKNAAKEGGIVARTRLGMDEKRNCFFRLASRHWLISAAAGDTESMEEIAELYKIKLVTKKEYSTTLASYVNVHKEEWSIEREKAATTQLCTAKQS